MSASSSPEPDSPNHIDEEIEVQPEYVEEDLVPVHIPRPPFVAPDNVFFMVLVAFVMLIILLVFIVLHQRRPVLRAPLPQVPQALYVVAERAGEQARRDVEDEQKALSARNRGDAYREGRITDAVTPSEEAKKAARSRRELAADVAADVQAQRGCDKIAYDSAAASAAGFRKLRAEQKVREASAAVAPQAVEQEYQATRL